MDVSYETIRRWALKLGPAIAQRLGKSRPKPYPQWHLDGMVARIGGRRVCVWRAVDAEGEILDALVQLRRDRKAAMRLTRKLLRKRGFGPTALVTDKLPPNAAAFCDLGLASRHERGSRLNNRAENSHRPIRRRERKMRRFKSAGPAQPFLSVHAAAYNVFDLQRHRTPRKPLRCFRTEARCQWRAAAAA